MTGHTEQHEAGELLPCPMCGTGPSSEDDATQVQIYWQFDGHCGVLCEECGVEGPERETYAEAIAAWNRRTPNTEPGGGSGAEEPLMVPRYATERMMEAGLYHMPDGVEWGDLFTAWHAMFDCIAMDGGVTARLPTEPAGGWQQEQVEAVARALAPTAFEPFDAKMHGSPVAQQNAQRMWLKHAQTAITTFASLVQPNPEAGAVEEAFRWIEGEPPHDEGVRILVENDRGIFLVYWEEDGTGEWCWICPDGKHDDRPLRGMEIVRWARIPAALTQPSGERP